MLMKRLIEKEDVPNAYDLTSLTQIWKKKGSALSLNNMRFIHMKCCRKNETTDNGSNTEITNRRDAFIAIS